MSPATAEDETVVAAPVAQGAADDSEVAPTSPAVDAQNTPAEAEAAETSPAQQAAAANEEARGEGDEPSKRAAELGVVPPPPAVLPGSAPAAEAKKEQDWDDAGAKPKARSLEQLMSLKPGDDERTGISKRISWILRHGARKASVTLDDEGWASVDEFLNCDILADFEKDKLLDVIQESNSQKARYEFREENGRRYIRAISKSRRKEAGRGERREKRRDGPPGGTEFERHRERVNPSAGQQQQPDEGPTLEQQLADGWKPVYQGESIIAMSKGDQMVLPGRTEAPAQAQHLPYHLPPPSNLPAPAPAPVHGSSWQQQQQRRPQWSDNKGYKGESKGYKGDDFGKGDWKGGGWKGDWKGDWKGGDWKGDWKGDGKGKHKGGFGGFDGGKGGFKGGKFHHGEEREDAYAHQFDGGKAESSGKGGYKGKGYGDGGGRQQQTRWRVLDKSDVVVRTGYAVESDLVGELPRGTLVTQIGKERVLKNGIIRMQIEPIDPPSDIKGWVTRTAEAAGGPVFFKQERERGGGKR